MFGCCDEYRHYYRNTWCGILSARRRGNIFVLREKRATSCLLFRPRSVLSVYSETSASHETVCLPFLYARSFPIRCGVSSPYRFFVPVFIYLSVRLYVSLFPSTCLTSVAAVSLLPQRPALACLPTFLFYKIDRTDETEETRSMGRNMRI